MIAIYTQSTHMKINYSEATDDEVSSSEAIITSSFRAEDSALKRTFAVKRGLASAVRSFYVQDSDDPRKSKNLLPVGFLPWLTQYYDNAGLAYEHIEMRKWPKIDKEYAHALVNGDVVLSGPDGTEYMPRDYQVKAVLIAAKHKIGLLQSPGGCLAGDTIINYNRQNDGRANTIEHLYKAHNKLYKNYTYNFDDRPTFVRSFNGKTIQLNEVDDIVYSGIKDLYLLTLENGKTLKATPEHLIMTKRGWIETAKLLSSDEVMLDTLHSTKIKNKAKKNTYKRTLGTWFHPYARLVNCTRRHGGFYSIDNKTKEVDTHRLIYEANLNNLLFVDFLYIIRNNESQSKILKFVDPKQYHIHHIDGNNKNNDISNLQMLTIEEHHKLHSIKHKYNFNQGIPQWCKVKSVEYYGKDHTYDICCIKNHNFVANGMIVHNSGKGLMLVLLCRLYKEHKILCLFNSIDLVMQTYDNFIKYGFNPAEVGIIQGQNFQDDRRVTIMSVASYEKAYHLFPQIKAIFVDESHSLGSGTGPEMATKVLYACQNAPVRIGLSATNDCIDNPFRQMALYGNLGPIVFEQTTQEKIADGTLVDVDTVMYNVNMPAIACTGNWADSYEQKTITTKKQKAELIAAGKEKFIYKDGSKEYYREMIARGDESKLYVFNNIRNEMIVRHAIENDRVLILYTRREHGEILERMIGEKIGIDKVKRVDGLDDGKTREEAKAFLLADKKNIILASTIFKQGVDIPHLHCLIIAGAGKGTTMVVQRFVRITRQHKESGKVKGKVIDYMDNFSSLSLRQSQKRLKAYSEYLGFEVKII